jgi:hypothetical protein
MGQGIPLIVKSVSAPLAAMSSSYSPLEGWRYSLGSRVTPEPSVAPWNDGTAVLVEKCGGGVSVACVAATTSTPVRA